MEKSQDGIWIIDAEGKTVFANARMAEILATSGDEMIGQNSFDYVYPEDSPAAQRLFESKMRGDTKPFHFRLRRKDGSPVWVDVQGTPLHNAAGILQRNCGHLHRPVIGPVSHIDGFSVIRPSD